MSALCCRVVAWVQGRGDARRLDRVARQRAYDKAIASGHWMKDQGRQ